MKWLEPLVEDVMTMEAKTTVAIARMVFPGADEHYVKDKKKDVFEALLALEDKGIVESRLARNESKRIVRWWVLVGGTYPPIAQDHVREVAVRHRRGLSHRPEGEE